MNISETELVIKVELKKNVGKINNLLVDLTNL